jgi:hypothetical protein
LQRGTTRQALSFYAERLRRPADLRIEHLQFVYSRFVLQHATVGSRGLHAGFVRVLRPGGVLVFQLPSDEEPPVSGNWLKRRLPLSLVMIPGG